MFQSLGDAARTMINEVGAAARRGLFASCISGARAPKGEAA